MLSRNIGASTNISCYSKPNISCYSKKYFVSRIRAENMFWGPRNSFWAPDPQGRRRTRMISRRPMLLKSAASGPPTSVSRIHTCLVRKGPYYNTLSHTTLIQKIHIIRQIRLYETKEKPDRVVVERKLAPHEDAAAVGGAGGPAGVHPRELLRRGLRPARRQALEPPRRHVLGPRRA